MPTSVPDRKSRHVTGRVPRMSETKYDIATSAQIAAALSLGALVALLVAIWLSNLLPDQQSIPILMETGDGGWEDGDPNESLDVESPEDPSDDPSLSNDQEVSQLEQITEQVLKLSDTAASMVQPNNFTDPSGGGNPGSAEGSGGRPYGSGGPGKGGTKRENRWVVTFADKGNLKSYARQLDQFKIEIGCAFPDGRIYYLSNMSTTPVVREGRQSAKDQRLFMNWTDGDRMKADAELLAAAGVPDPTSGKILHFYNPNTEQQLARLELDYANKPIEQIRRTYFEVRRKGNEFEFAVVNQKLK
ncbi:hypothetical protein [Fuerstiella marisgermanici]|uniref:Uncharacterized protein n=1 Tax=Fuerstiella marisgermanici TaxID=1891926 RepID=A0A1P8WBI6_9PLAN|nr:hypothetical protein [Fuerstiella marisgermanici]APZ91419.1 hypothetical protein Fuma_01007 [Fuerstiella marisgermanici]